MQTSIFGIVVARCARWFLMRFGHRPTMVFDAEILRPIFRQLKIAKWCWIATATYSYNICPYSGDAVTVIWSSWLKFGPWYRGYGAVRDLVRNEDLEVKIGTAGPFASESGEIALNPPVKVTRFQLQIRNASREKRNAQGSAMVSVRKANDSVRGILFKFNPLPAGQTTLVSSGDVAGELNEPAEAFLLKYHLAPTGRPRFVRLYGKPEWTVEK